MTTTVPPLPLPFRVHPQLELVYNSKSRPTQAIFIKTYTMLLYLYCYQFGFADQPLEQFTHGLSVGDREAAFDRIKAIALWCLGINDPPAPTPQSFSPTLSYFLYRKVLQACFGASDIAFHEQMAQSMLPDIIWDPDPSNLYPQPWPNIP